MLQLTDSQRFPSPEHRVRFGRTLTAWLARGGWAHDTPQKWGQAVGFPCVKNSTYSQLQRGQIEQPKPLTFYQLGLMNDRLARRDYGTIHDVRLRQRVQAQEPIVGLDGKPWTAVDFFGHFMGMIAPPDWVIGSSEPTEEEAERITRELVSQFQEVARDRMLTPLDAWNQLSPYCRQLNKAELDKLRNVLSGWHVFTPAELVDLGNGEPGSRVARALNAWKLSEASP